MESILENNVLTIKLDGRVDSNTAPTYEKEIFDIVLDRTSDVVLDVEKLEYISSAGLRVVLKLLKQVKNLKIVNCSSDTYDVFQMTGFTEMMTVQKAFRVIDVEGCEVIGEGANGKVYRISDDTIIKAYLNPKVTLDDIKKETALARKAFVSGIPTAIPYDVVKVGNSYGSVFELLNAKSFAKLMVEDQENLSKYIELYIDLVKKIHATEVKEDELVSQKEQSLLWVDQIKEYISSTQAWKLKKMIEDIPETHHMLHGDYHIKNVMMQNDEVLLIDMDTLCQGHPIYELSQMFNAYVGHYKTNDHSQLTFLGIPWDLSVEIWNKSLRLYYKDKTEEELSSLEEKIELVGYVRILKHMIKRDDLTNPDKKKKFDFILQEIVRLTEKLDDLSI